MPHIPVLLHEVIELTDPKEGEFVVDGTAGEGGHAEAFAERIGPRGTLLCLDWDADALAATERRLSGKKGGPRAKFVHANYAALPDVLRRGGYGAADIALLDLGFSSRQIDDPARGFSFRSEDAPLDMRYDTEGGPTAAEAVNGLGEEALTEIFRRYGEERNARGAARAVVAARRKARIITVGDLVRALEPAFSAPRRKGRVHFATKIFQALRIRVNRELENLGSFLDSLPGIMRPGGRAAIVTFHSLEDRLVKRAFRSFAAEQGAMLVTKRPAVPGADERKRNPRSRSAKLRIVRFQ